MSNDIEILQLDLDREKSIANEYCKRLLKAIKYIEDHTKDRNGIYLGSIEKKELLDILEGNDNE